MNEKKYLTIGEAAKEAHTTSETLRHYDRIGLVSPSRKDEYTNYRYYSREDIIRLNTVRALQMMDLSLNEIRKVLQYDSLEEIIGFLSGAEKKADEKIAALEYSKKKIALARADYESKLRWQQQGSSGIAVKEIPERVIMLSGTRGEPTLDNLWNYLGHFYGSIPAGLKDQFSFEDLAGIYNDGSHDRLFALCTRYAGYDGLKILPAGKYLIAGCTEENRKRTMEELCRWAEEEYGAKPEFTL